MRTVHFEQQTHYTTCMHETLPPTHTHRYGLYKQLVLRFGAGTERRKEAAAAAATSIAAAAAASQMSDSAAAAEAALAAAGAKPVLHVATVGAQLRSLEDTAEAMCWAAGVTPSGKQLAPDDHRPHADALLLVSGSHPMRQLPLAAQLLPGSVKMLQRGAQLKQAGVLPPHLELWAVANPVTEPDASYTEQKVGGYLCLNVWSCGKSGPQAYCDRVDSSCWKSRALSTFLNNMHTSNTACCAAVIVQVAAGANVILTQPPLDWPAFESWMADARRRGLHEAARLLVGFPCLSSAANCGFWLALCNAGGNAEVRRGR